MRKRIILYISLFVAGFSYAQTSTENYIQSTTCLDADCIKKFETVQYLDYLGRPKQIVGIKATPTGKDLVTPIVYDELGRQTRSYLPVPQLSTTNGNIYPQNAGMVPYPVADATNFYGGEKTYTEKTLEKSPLERVLDQRQVGNAWNNKPITFGYDINSLADHVKQYEVVTTWDLTEKLYKNELKYTVSGYAVGKLMKNTVTDQDGNKTIEFKDGSGQTVLIRKVINASQNADTYYLYNDYKQLAYVIPPTASAGTLNETVVNNFCYQYKYDSKGRQVEKKLPGKGWEYFIYDKQNRLIMTQDAKMGDSRQWFFSKYDQFGRIAYTGIYTSTQAYGTAGRVAEQALVDAKGNNNVVRMASVGFIVGGRGVYYSNNNTSYPNSINVLLSISYYDTYPVYSFNPTFPTDILGSSVITDNSTGNSISTKGLPVMTLVKNIEDDNWTSGYNFYDNKGRIIGTYSVNHLGGYTKTESELDFTGLAKQTKVYHKRLATDVEKVITQTFTYDNQNRLLVNKHKVDSNPEEILTQNDYNELSQLRSKKVGGTSIASPLQIINYTYNIQGWLTKINDPANLNGKLFGYEMRYNNPVNTNIAPGRFNGNIAEVDWKNASEDILKRYNYEYDNLDRLKKALYNEPITGNEGKYDEYLTYDLNGNINNLKRTAVPVSQLTPTVVDNLDYQYTGNRLDKVIENSMNDTGYEGGNNPIDYDLNGNMINMKDKGINTIAYNYLNLPDSYSITQNDPFSGVVNFGLNYLYRADGVKIRKTNTRGGGKGKPTTKNIIDYLDGFQYSYYESSTCLWCKTSVAFEQEAFKDGDPVLEPVPLDPQWILDFVPTAEGYYSFKENRYIYQYKDHLGNARVSYAKNSAGALEITDTNNYYAFGMNHIGQGKGLLGGYNNYKYNGKEIQETGFYDYGARFYMPDLGRWGVIDAMSEKYRRHSPYNYAVNNPIMFIDPDGNDVTTYTGEAARQMFSAYKASMSLSSELGNNYFTGFNFSQFGNGDNNPPDDHFNQFGKFLYTDNKKTNNIVIDFQNPITGALNTAPWLSVELKDYIFDKNNFSIIMNIAKYYAKAAGVDLANLRNGEFSGSVWNGQKWEGGQPILKSGTFNTFNGGTYSYKGVLSTIKHDRTINFTVTNGHLNGYLNDKYNLISTLEHEGGKVSHLTVNMQSPIDDSDVAQRNEHLILYKNQINSPTFKKTTLDYQKLILSNYKDVKNGATGN
ncbi:DUF6443 domain-containing protein [Chryseobacterium sp. LAM-KRS1]|uniref:DUF6443 domain-containing protein n=1 Tax=Chryseobacterium sp. LAM-KRS1 TaxID=2715754 RepID=UPI001551EFB5|nr:DUF6443 domain-containing protein [Chryseobacterium sp. LAM-KRS1]